MFILELVKSVVVSNHHNKDGFFWFVCLEVLKSYCIWKKQVTDKDISELVKKNDYKEKWIFSIRPKPIRAAYGSIFVEEVELCVLARRLLAVAS